LRDNIRQVEVIHGHGLWLAPNLEAGWAAKRGGVPFVLTPHGMLSEVALGYSLWKKRIMWAMAQGAVARSAACIHVTSEAELADVRAIGLRQPVAVIPNGIDLPPTEDRRACNIRRTVLALGRVHPKKNLAGLIRAWAIVEPRRSDWSLRIAGPAEDGHDATLRVLAGELGLSRVSITGPAYGEATTTAYREADLFVLPTANENFGLTVAEALAAGTPVIATKGAPWAGLEHKRCGWWVDHGVDALAAALESATALPRQALLEMGARGREWMKQDYSWDGLAELMADVYLWLARDAEPPACVRFD
jgi:glycosyltransferase involved in cell wall biosynthesis